MVIYLDAACFMANTFAVCPENSLNLNRLRAIKDYVEDYTSKHNAIIDWTRDSFYMALEIYRNNFRKTGENVECISSPEDRTKEFVSTCFNFELDLC